MLKKLTFYLTFTHFFVWEKIYAFKRYSAGYKTARK